MQKTYYIFQIILENGHSFVYISSDLRYNLEIMSKFKCKINCQSESKINGSMQGNMEMNNLE